MSFSYLLIDMAGSEIAVVTDERSEIARGDIVTLPDGRNLPVVEVYDADEGGTDDGVQATLVVEDR
jgi:hypothetical protein